MVDGINVCRGLDDQAAELGVDVGDLGMAWDSGECEGAG